MPKFIQYDFYLRIAEIFGQLFDQFNMVALLRLDAQAVIGAKSNGQFDQGVIGKTKGYVRHGCFGGNGEVVPRAIEVIVDLSLSESKNFKHTISVE